jgi:hypothetical protein
MLNVHSYARASHFDLDPLATISLLICRAHQHLLIVIPAFAGMAINRAISARQIDQYIDS